MEKTASGAVAVTGREPGQAGPAKTIVAKNIITAGGLHADNVAKTAGGDSNPAVLTFRGTYYQMKPEFRDICSTNIYPVPSGGGIPVGVHFTPTLDERRGNQMIVGPGACMGFATEAYKFTDVSIVHLWKLAQQIGLWRFVFSNWDLAFTEMYVGNPLATENLLEVTGGTKAPHQVTSRYGSLLLLLSADVHTLDDVIASEGTAI